MVIKELLLYSQNMLVYNITVLFKGQLHVL